MVLILMASSALRKKVTTTKTIGTMMKFGLEMT
jgi:hypothetical protein